MPKHIITVTMQWGGNQWHPINPRGGLGWTIMINGLTPQHRTYLRSSTELSGRAIVETVNGAVVDLMITPVDDPSLSFRNGARANEPPFSKVTEVLNALGYIGYEVATSQMLSGDHGNTGLFGVWTLQMERQRELD